MHRWLKRLFTRASIDEAFRLRRAGDWRQAESECRRVLRTNSNDAEALCLLGEIEHATGRHADAMEHLSRAAQAAPGYLAAHVNLAAAAMQAGIAERAAQSASRALEIDPRCLQAACNLSIAQLALGNLDDAQRSAERAIGIDPAFAPAHTQLGDTLLAKRMPAQAARSYAEAARLMPQSAVARASEGYALQVAGDLQGALARYDEALALDPHHVQAHVNRAAVRLLQGRYAEGWDEYEWRLRNPAAQSIHAAIRAPRWDGEPLDGKTLAVYAEQGLGDQIMYASCLPELLPRAGRCIVGCDPRLVSLFARAFPRAEIRADAQDGRAWSGTGTIDAKVAMASLPFHLRRSPADFPRRASFLHADRERVAHWRARLERLGAGRKIGLAWRGGVPATGRVHRSVPLETLRPLLATPGVSFVDLEYADSTDERIAFGRAHDVALHRWPEAIGDYEETAALVSALDLVISVCTAIVHLAGALGRPTWVLAPLVPEPRYGLAGEAMIWYPAVTVLRQPRYGDWNSVVNEAARRLCA